MSEPESGKFHLYYTVFKYSVGGYYSAGLYEDLSQEEIRQFLALVRAGDLHISNSGTITMTALFYDRIVDYIKQRIVLR